MNSPDLVVAAQQALETLEASRRSHYYCEDTWHSCPKHEDGCFNEMEGDECNCGADEVNEKIDQSITALRAALAQQTEPVHPSGFVYRYPDGVRFNDGCEVNGCLPSEAIPYYFGKAPPKAQQTKSSEDEE